MAKKKPIISPSNQKKITKGVKSFLRDVKKGMEGYSRKR